MTRSRAQHPTRHQGFTLLELMVVVLIIGILATFASLSIGNRVLEDKLEVEARRTEQVLRLASDEAESKGVEIGVRFTEGGYRLLAVNTKKRWADYEESGALRTRVLEEPVLVALSVEGRPVTLAKIGDPEPDEPDDDDDTASSRSARSRNKLEPQVFLLSSGENTPFVLELFVPGVPLRYRLESDGFGKLSLNRLAGKPV